MRRMSMEQSEMSAPGRDVDLEVIGAASADVCILLTGPSTPAMELARRIHGLGRGRPGRFRVVSCGWPESLLEEQLFHALRPGSSGTLFLEEVGRLSPELQERLLETLSGSADPRSPIPPREIGRASCRERMKITEVGGTL